LIESVDGAAGSMVTAQGHRVTRAFEKYAIG